MADPIVELLTANIAAELAEITAAAGWNYTLSVKRPKDIDFGKEGWADLTVLVAQTKSELVSEGLGLKQMRQNYLIVAFVTDGDNSDDPIDTKRNRVVADIQKKLMEAPKRGHANCRWTTVGDATPFRPSDKGIGGVTIDVAVEYQTQTGNPYA
jgi:hypothetical protein